MKLEVKELGCKGVSCIYLTQGCVCRVKEDLYSFWFFQGLWLHRYTYIMKKYQHMKAFIGCCLDYSKHRTEKTSSFLQRYLQVKKWWHISRKTF